VAWADDQPVKDDIRPCALAVGTELRIVYVLRATPIITRQLAPQTEYTVGLFDPVTGEQVALGKARMDATGSWRCSPSNHGQDWVLVLEKQGGWPKR
jgi:hypothetical protein